MKKTADFLVDKRKIIAVIMAVIVVVCAFFAFKVQINHDMTKYLPDDSQMKAGVDLMAQEFPDSSTISTIRVMFKGLSDSEKTEMAKRLGDIENVSNVDYSEGEDYNSGEYTKYVLTVGFVYGSDEELAVEKTLERDFSQNDMQYKNDNTATADLPIWIIAVAVACLFIILFLMCNSWFEPLLFIVSIACAIIINLGTNIFLGSVSDITFSISSILQLVLSMDYSIILINRYRQEKKNFEDPEEAMSSAVKNAFSSIASSAFTTVVGLLALLFMSFKIGQDLGLVLAKGVVCSIICNFTILPFLILACDEIITKTAKKELPLRMEKIASLSFRARHVIAAVFALIFIASCVLQNFTGVAYSLKTNDPIAEVFPTDETLVILYNNKDESSIDTVISQLKNDEAVKTATAYSNTLGTAYTSAELTDIIASLGDDIRLDASMLNIVYYDYFKGGAVPTITAGGFLSFIKDDVLNNKTFSSYIGSDVKDNISMLSSFSDASQLTRPLTTNELASFFGMDETMVKQLMILYYSENGGVNTGSMTLTEFCDLIVNDISSNPVYASMFDADTKAQIETLSTFTNAELMTTPCTASEMAAITGMDASTISMVYLAYGRGNSNIKITPQNFINYVTDDIMTDSALASYFNESAKAKLRMVKTIIDSSVDGTKYTAPELASLLGMDEKSINSLYLVRISLYGDTSGWKISVQNFINFLNGTVLKTPEYASQIDEKTSGYLALAKRLSDAVVSGKEYTPEQLAEIFDGASEDLDANTIGILMLYYGSKTDYDSTWKLTIENLFDFLSNNILNDPRFSSVLNGTLGTQIVNMENTLNAGIAQLKGGNYSRLILTSSIDPESAEADEFFTRLDKICSENLSGDYYFIGNSAMTNEMKKSFGSEMNLITVLTAVAIFLVVAFTFRSVAIPFILVLLVQCGVFLTISVMGLIGGNMYYLAMLIVQCILMGSTIDYGILFTSYYREKRKTLGIKEALTEAYNGSIHTIMTSGLIMVIVTFIVGFCFEEETIAQICRTLSVGALCAILLILFILPGMLSSFDKLTSKLHGKEKKAAENKD